MRAISLNELELRTPEHSRTPKKPGTPPKNPEHPQENSEHPQENPEHHKTEKAPMVVSAISTLLLTEPIAMLEPLRQQYSALPTELGYQLGAGHFAGS